MLSSDLNEGTVTEANLSGIMQSKVDVERALSSAYDAAAAIGLEIGIHQERSRVLSELELLYSNVEDTSLREMIAHIKILVG